jgi:hypothetical protein
MLRQFIQRRTKICQSFNEKPGTPPELSLLYLRMRQCIGIIGVALPPVLIIGMILLEGHSKILDSISVYYYNDNTDYRKSVC